MIQTFNGDQLSTNNRKSIKKPNFLKIISYTIPFKAHKSLKFII